MDSSRTGTKSVDHKELYKMKPSWKETYRKRCLERLKLGRERQVAEQRQIRVVDTIKQVMDEEMATMATEDGIEMQDLVDFLLTVEEELRQEAGTDSHYEEAIKFEEASLEAQLKSASTSGVICPLCTCNFLQQQHSVIHCHCGLQVDTDQDCISLEYVRDQLEDNITQHSLQCPAKPAFSIKQVPDLPISNLLMTCQSCGYIGIVI